MNPTYQRMARERERIEETTPDPSALDRLEQRVSELEERYRAIDLRLADALAGERQNVRAELEQLRADLMQVRTVAAVGLPKATPTRRTPAKRTR